MNDIEFFGFFNTIKDSKGNDYFGLEFNPNSFKEYEQFMIKKNLEEELSLKLIRDNGNYHITIFNAKEWGYLTKQNLHSEIIKEYSLKNHKVTSYGIGKIQNQNNVAYFFVCPDDFLGKIREKYNFSHHDFHITIGFKEKDIFSIPKNKDTIIFIPNDIINSSKKFKI